MHRRTVGTLGVPFLLLIATITNPTAALAHAYPKSSDPPPNARVDAAPAHIGITYDSPIDAKTSPITLLDSTGAQVPSAADSVDGITRVSISPTSDLAPGPYTVGWTSVSAEDGHAAQGFYTFVVNGGPVGILTGEATAQTGSADLVATLTVYPAEDGGSLLRVDLNNPTGVERVRIRLSRADLGEDLLDTHPSGDGGWLLAGNEIALPGAWHAVVIVRRTNIFDDAMGVFDFTVDATSGIPTFT